MAEFKKTIQANMAIVFCLCCCKKNINHKTTNLYRTITRNPPNQMSHQFYPKISSSTLKNLLN